MHKVLWAESRHCHSSWEMSTVTSLNVNSPWNKRAWSDHLLSGSAFLDIRRRNVYKWRWLLKRMMSNAVIFYHKCSNSVKIGWYNSLTSIIHETSTLMSGHCCLSLMDAVFMLHRISADMYQKENSLLRKCHLHSVPVDHAKTLTYINPGCTWVLHVSIVSGLVGMFKL